MVTEKLSTAWGGFQSQLIQRPKFYFKVSLLSVGAVLALTVFRSIVETTKEFPILPEFLELVGASTLSTPLAMPLLLQLSYLLLWLQILQQVGLGWTLWFIFKFVTSKDTRQKVYSRIESITSKEQ